MSDDGIYYGPGTTPGRVARAVERAKDQRREQGNRPAVSTGERERFFARIAEDRKRAEAGQ